MKWQESFLSIFVWYKYCWSFERKNKECWPQQHTTFYRLLWCVIFSWIISYDSFLVHKSSTGGMILKICFTNNILFLKIMLSMIWQSNTLLYDYNAYTISLSLCICSKPDMISLICLRPRHEYLLLELHWGIQSKCLCYKGKTIKTAWVVYNVSHIAARHCLFLYPTMYRFAHTE